MSVISPLVLIVGTVVVLAVVAAVVLVIALAATSGKSDLPQPHPGSTAGPPPPNQWPPQGGRPPQ